MIKVNPTKSTHVCFTLRKGTCPNVFLKNEHIPQKCEVRYLGLILDKKLTWKSHIKKKRLLLNYKLRQLWRFVNRRSSLPISSKLLLYKSLLKPIWTYGVQLFGSAKTSNLKSLQIFQSKFLRIASNAPYYVKNETLHSDFKIPYIKDVAQASYQKFFSKLQDNPNPLIQDIHQHHLPGNPVRRLKRRWCRDLL